MSVPTVSSVVPDHSERGVTLDITINGSGFDRGSVARLERDRVPADKITTNSTTFVMSRERRSMVCAIGMTVGRPQDEALEDQPVLGALEQIALERRHTRPGHGPS